MKVNLFNHLNETFKVLETLGVLLVSIDRQGRSNVMTIGWLLLGLHYNKKKKNPVAVVAVHPDRYTFKLLDEIEEFVVAVPKLELKKDVAFCGENSGRAVDKFKETSLTPIPSNHVKPPSIKECIVNIECRIYNKITRPQAILIPKHGICSVYFAEVLGVYKY